MALNRDKISARRGEIWSIHVQRGIGERPKQGGGRHQSAIASVRRAARDMAASAPQSVVRFGARDRELNGAVGDSAPDLTPPRPHRPRNRHQIFRMKLSDRGSQGD